MKKYLIVFTLLICSKPLFAQITLPFYVPTSGLLAWYPFTGNAIDSSGHGNNGTVHGATLTTDRFGNTNSAYYFNGTSDSISTSFLPPTGDSARTITCWFKYDSLLDPCGDLGLCIIGYGGDNRGCYEADKNFSLEVSYISSPPRTDVDGICIATSASSMSDTLSSNWHFFAAVYDPSYGDFTNIKLYLDGAFKTTTTVVYGGLTAVITDTLSKLLIGAGHYDCPRYFDGKIDDIGVWNRALSLCELTDLYNSDTTCGHITGITHICDGASITLSSAPLGGSWSSGSPAIAIVDSGTGIVTGISAGTTVITYTYGSVTATTIVTVYPLPSAGSIHGINGVCAGDTISLAETDTGGVWSSSNTVISTVDGSGNVIGVTAGIDTIKYTVTSGDYGCSATATFPLTVSLCNEGVKQINNENIRIINIAPNPAHNTLYISATSTITHIAISNLLGQVVFSNNYFAKSIEVNVAGLPAGVYFIRVNECEVRKFVKE